MIASSFDAANYIIFNDEYYDFRHIKNNNNKKQVQGSIKYGM